MKQTRLFVACIVALVATAFGFIIRALIVDQWQQEFNLTETQKGDILGCGLYPFAISIILFSLIVDRVGYGRVMVFAFIGHVVSAIVTICATFFADGDGSLGYWFLLVGTFIVALANGAVEAVINPVTATLYPRDKTHYLNILHAGWPGGLVLGGLLVIGMTTLSAGEGMEWLDTWQWKVGLILIPTLIYGVMLLGCRFPVSERVAAGVSYRDMLRELGALGAIFIVAIFTFGWGSELPWWGQAGIIAVLGGGYGIAVGSIGRPMFFLLLVIMAPLATTELGTDSWISDLMAGELTAAGWHFGWVLVYTSLIMFVLRFFAGPIVHRISPLGLLAVSAAIACVGLVWLSRVEGLLMIFFAATLYGFGKTFFWPTMLGVAAEQYPKGGALTLNTVGGVGMLAVGLIGAPFLGALQDDRIDTRLQDESPPLHAEVVQEEQTKFFMDYRPVDQNAVETLSPEAKSTVETIREDVKQNLLMTVAIFPAFMFVCYVLMILYFRARGGYRAEVLTGHGAKDEQFTGGTEGPGEG